MWYNKNNNEVIDRAKGVVVNGVQYPLDIFILWSEQELNSIGIFTVADDRPSIDEATQNIVVSSIELLAGVPTRTYLVSSKSPEEVTAYQVQQMSQLVQHFTEVTTSYIEDKVQAYNQANGVAFKDIDAFTKYAVTATSPYNAIANRFIDYADRVWTAVRTYQATATTIPTDVEFKAILDGVVF